MVIKVDVDLGKLLEDDRRAFIALLSRAGVRLAPPRWVYPSELRSGMAILVQGERAIAIGPNAYVTAGSVLDGTVYCIYGNSKIHVTGVRSGVDHLPDSDERTKELVAA